MKGNDPAYLEAERLAQKFFPEYRAFVALNGLWWDDFLGAMMTADDFQSDWSCDPYRFPDSPVLGFAEKGGIDGTAREVYLRVLEHTGIHPAGRAVIVFDTLGHGGESYEDYLPIICDSKRVPERLDELDQVFGFSRDMVFIFESGEAILINHDNRLFWASSRIIHQTHQRHA